MKVLLIGSRGQLARALAEAAAAHDAEIVALGRPHLDITRPRSVSEALAREHPDIVINTAAFTHVDRAEAEPEVAFAVNAKGAATVARACDARGLPLIHLSTDYVFDGRKTRPFMETDMPSPLNVYGASKLAGERSIAEHCRNQIIVRTSWLYSAFGSNFVKTMLTLAASKPEIAVVDDQRGNPTSAFHLADALLAIAAHVLGDGTPRFAGIYHAAGGGTVSWHGLAEEIFRCSRLLGGPHAKVRPISTHDYNAAAERPHNSALDCRKLQHTFGLKLPRWEAGIRHTVARLVADHRVSTSPAHAEPAS
jgi:dTDP-4-dehydrorhamnose reductase